MFRVIKYTSWIIIATISLLLVVIWFHSGLITGGGEEGLIFYNPTKTYELTKTMWWEYDTGSPTLTFLPLRNAFFILALLQQLFHIPNYILQAGTYFFLLFIGGSVMCLLTNDFIKKNQNANLIALVAAIFYMLNPFSMTQIWGRGLTPQFFAFALLPLSLFLFLRIFKYKSIIYLCLFALLSTLFSAAFGINTFIIDYWVVLTVALLTWFIITAERVKKDYVIYYFLSILFWTLCNFDWLMSTLLTGNQIYSGESLVNTQANIGTLLGVSPYFQFPSIIRLLQDFYFFNPGFYGNIYSTFYFQAISILMPIFLCIGCYVSLFKKEFGKFKIFLVLFILGLLVSLGANPPLGFLFVKLFKHISILQAFRNPYEKFGIVYALGYSPLFALGLVYFFRSLFKNRRIQIFGIILSLVLICGIFAWPMWSGKILAVTHQKVGVAVPRAYEEVNNWLNSNNKNNFRITMTPLWSGDGSFYQWGTSQYLGLDPMFYLIDTPAISNNPTSLSFYSDFMRHVRLNIYKEDITGALSLFRTKYLVNRKDAIAGLDITNIQYLTKEIYPPNQLNNLSQEICQNKIASSSASENQPWIACKIDNSNKDFGAIKYLDVIVKVDRPATIEFAITDTKGTRPTWHATTGDGYYIQANKWTSVLIPLEIPTDPNGLVNLHDITMIEVTAHLLDQPNEFVNKIALQGIWLDKGLVKKVDNYALIKSFDILNIYKPKKLNTPPQLGLLASVEQVNNFEELIIKSKQEYNTINKHGFLVTSENTGKNMGLLKGKYPISSVIAGSNSNTRYYVTLNKPNDTLLILSEKFNSGWKVIPDVSSDDLKDNLFTNIALLKKSFVTEDNHFVVNGYANLWKISGSKNYAVVFLPQIYADIGRDISFVAIIILIIILLYNFLTKKYKFVLSKKSLNSKKR